MKMANKSFWILFLVLMFMVPAFFANAYEYKLSSGDKRIFTQAFQQAQRDRYESAIADAGKSNDKVIGKIIKWVSYQDGYNGKGLQEIAKFMRQNLQWPNQKKIRNKAEFSLTGTEPASDVIKYFDEFPPLTGHGMRILAEAKIATGIHNMDVINLLKQGWKQGDFSREQEDSFLQNHKKILSEDDIYGRVDRLLWEGDITSAKRLYNMLSPSHKHIVLGRIHLMQNKPETISKVPKSLRNDPGLIYEQVRIQYNRENFKLVYRILHDVVTPMPFQEKWWKIKNRLIRELLDENKIKEAYYIASHHGNEAGSGNYADAEWLAGWISLRFLGKSEKAYTHFYNMYNNVSYPVSLSRAAYWAGRAAEAKHETDIAKNWFKVASEHSTTFYGQLAYSKLNGRNSQLAMPLKPEMGVLEKNGHIVHELLMAAYVLESAGKSAMAEQFIKTAIENVETPSEMAYISEFGIKIGRNNLAVIAAKGALTKGVALIEQGWPTTKYMPRKIDIEEPFALSIIRQESVFNPSALSSAKAMGFMQLIPSTAKRMAKSVGVSYSSNKLLSDPKYNITLGSYYLGSLVNQWDGSYILAISSYNAGPGNARKWAEKYNDPRKIDDINDIIDWIESIPFGETRNYVQRVLENIQVYRSKMADNKFNIIDDLLRGNTNKG